MAFDYAPPDSPDGAFATAPVRIVDDSLGVVRVPWLPVGEHTVTFVCGRDAAFAHPEFDGRLEVLSGSG